MGDNSNVYANNLPPGFRFYPTDEELVVHFLQRKAALLPCHPDVIPDLHLYPYDPWELDGKALSEGKQWYFYSRRTQNRNTNNGYWKATGMEEAVVNGSSSRRVGIKRYLVFYIGDGEGVKTNWIMHEYRLSDSDSSSTSGTRSSKRRPHISKMDYSKWVVCRVYETNSSSDGEDDGRELSCLDEVFLSLDDLDEINNWH
ncbi:phosphatidylserine decarboxylase proenzyme 3-like [Hibiscus syriacus]|uniref:Phosphatidylserine decarboxylase proenzyme 3-like n=1 Tax=Hibiscus syriacus TaxID=106335 RepID=A0A6A2Z6X2_HIBSY|nr:NAC domain-containing protein 104-like [Hibiscus syriacus]KAE8687731.1 phosphatidylserine decarboxylase proenzyme 3-like [Hibiscus syriacus]